MQIKKIAVLGSGVMGMGIAAHCANAGLDVVLLDIVSEDASNRNQLAEGAIDRALTSTPSPFAHPRCAKRVTASNLEDGGAHIAQADWIIEAVLERLDVKQAVYRQVDGLRKAGSIVSSNTSTLPLARLTEGLSAKFAADFCIAHFFNPVRFMPLLEMLPSPGFDAARFEKLCAFGEETLGKEVVKCKDTPGFIANRIGIYFMTLAMNEGLNSGLSVEDMDAALSKPYGIPKTGVFGLYDLIGLDLMPLIAKAMVDNIPASDPFAALNPKPPLLEKLIAEGFTGRKGKGGFYRMVKDGEKKIKQTLDLSTGEYHAENPVKEPSEQAAAFAASIIQKTVDYATALLPEIAYSAADIDRAMQAGYSWKRGVFGLVGSAQLAVGSEKSYITYNALKTKPAIFKTPSATLWDAGDGVEVFDITTKMHAFDEGVFDALEAALARTPKALIIAPDGELFSAGANLKHMLAMAENGDKAAVRAFIARGQQMMLALKTAKLPVVAALHGLALGGGCETLLHCSKIVAHMESQPGLVEVNVGLIPAWGGTKEMLLRHENRISAFQHIMAASKAESALHARDLKILREEDAITMSRPRLLAEAKAEALRTRPLTNHESRITSAAISAAELLASVSATGHQATIAGLLADVVSMPAGTSEKDLLARELDVFVELILSKPTQMRIHHMLETGKPLKN